MWLRQRGFEKILQDKKRKIFAICGGYEMMFENIRDPQQVESKIENILGFGRFKGDVGFQKEKIVKQGCYNHFGVMGSGYEIHNGVAKKNAKKKKNLYGTFIHGIFENDNFRAMIFSAIDPAYKGYNFHSYKSAAIKEFADHVHTHLDMQKIVSALHE